MAMIRKIDPLGRIVIPKEWLNDAGIKEKDEMLLTYDVRSKKMTLEKYALVGACSFCGEVDVEKLLQFKNGLICTSCLAKLRGDKED